MPTGSLSDRSNRYAVYWPYVDDAVVELWSYLSAINSELCWASGRLIISNIA